MHSSIDLPRQFRLTIRDAIRDNPQMTRAVHAARRRCIYMSGERDASVYCIDSGKVKLALYTQEGRECVLAVRAEGDIFGELCLSGWGARVESAVAMEEVHLKAMHYLSLMKILRGASLLEDLVHYLAGCIAEHEEFIASLLSLKSERRLAEVLLHLGTACTPEAHGKIVAPRILYTDLAAMVGTTRSRVGFFIKHFQERGLIEVNPDQSFTLDVAKLRRFAIEGSSKGNAEDGDDENRVKVTSAASLVDV